MPTRLTKAFNSLLTPRTVQKAARGTMSDFVIGAPHIFGQPLPLTSDAQGLITPQRMREIIMKTPTASASINAILDYVGGVKLDLRNVNAAKPVPPRQLARVQKMLKKPNTVQTARQFRLALFRDLITLGFAAIEIEPDANGEPANLWVMDAARLRIDYDEHGSILGYDMLDAHGMPVMKGRDDRQSFYSLPEGVGIGAYTDNLTGKGEHGWEPDEVIFFSLNPMSESAYPYSRITQLFTIAVIEDLMMYFIGQRFTDSNIPFGVMDLGDISEPELQIAINNWNRQANDQHKIMLTGSKSGAKWIPFGYHLKDLEATALLAEVRGKIMAILGVTMNELGESQDINKSNGYNLSYTFKKRAIEPPLNEVVDTLSLQLLWNRFGFTDIELYYEELDSRDELLQAQIDDLYLKMGVININQIRNRRGDENVTGGEVNSVFTGSAWIPVSMITKMAQQMLASEAASTQGGSVTGPEGADTERLRVGGQSPQGSKGPPGRQEGAAHTQRQVTGQASRT